MDLDKTLKTINQSRVKAECCFVFSLWKDPEMYADYLHINENKDQTLVNQDAIFYYDLGKMLFKQGYRKFDAITIDTFLTSKPKIKEKFDEFGGYTEVERLKQCVDIVNADTYYDQIAKMNTLTTLAEKYDDIFNHVDRFANATNEDVYNAFDLLNSSAALANSHDVQIEDLAIDDQFLEDCNDGLSKGLSYAKNCPALNYITMGIPLGDLTMIAGYSGTGKSSWMFENLVLPFQMQGIKVAIISNEMRADVYKNMLTVHILTQDLNYWKLTRKKIKDGNFTDEEWEKLKEAQKIQKEKYNGIKFIKMFDNETNKVVRYMRKLATSGYTAIIYDTFKSDDTGSDDSMWQELLLNSRKIFQVASKYNIAVVTTYQLALGTLNQRYLDATTLSNSKQIKEVFSEILMVRELWYDEFTGEKKDCKPYTLKKDENGKWIRDMTIELDKTKKYLVFFVNKTRNDEDQQQILYRFDGKYNHWREIGRCTIINTHGN